MPWRSSSVPCFSNRIDHQTHLAIVALDQAERRRDAGGVVRGSFQLNLTHGHLYQD